MKHSSIWPRLILIALALLLSAANGTTDDQLGPSHPQSKTKNKYSYQTSPPTVNDQNTSQAEADTGSVNSYKYFSFDHFPTRAQRFLADASQTAVTVSAVFTGALVVLAIWAGRIAQGTLRQIRHEAFSTGIAARAANRNATTAERSLTHLERPWIFAEITRFIGFKTTPIGDDFRANGALWVTVTWQFQNHGRTPAFIFDGGIRLTVIPTPVPEQPDYGESAPTIALVPLAGGISRVNEVLYGIGQDEHRSLLRDQARFMFFGFIKYRDLFGSEHTSRWCMTLKIKSFRITGQPEFYWQPEGPPAWTEYT